MPKIERSPTYLGIDPGGSGGVAFLSGGEVKAYPMPATMADVWELFQEGDRVGEVFAVIEQVGGYVGEAQPGSSAFKFGRSYGSLLMALTAAQIPYEEVIPRTWQKALGVPPRRNKAGETKTQFKNRLKAKAQQLFPTVKVTLGVADSLLIAEFCKRKREGKLG